MHRIKNVTPDSDTDVTAKAGLGLTAHWISWLANIKAKGIENTAKHLSVPSRKSWRKNQGSLPSTGVWKDQGVLR